MKGIMIQGTASDVGKSVIVTALCRILANEGVEVAPFKSQNMSNNSYVTKDGREIGRAQGIQAEAAKIDADVWMNPILLKPRSNQNSEVVYLGRAIDTLSGRGYRETFYEKGLEVIKESIQHLEQEYEMVVIEGAGSPVEINLKDRELVNMKVAELADVPVVLVGDIDRGGVFASVVGTLELLDHAERERVVGIIINKFRGDISLFEDGIEWLENRTGLPVLGVLPFIDNHMIDGEDSLSIHNKFHMTKKGAIDIVVIHLPFISNYSDMEPFLYEDVTVRWVDNASDFGQPDAVIIPGTKSTISDMHFIKAKGLDVCIQEHVARGGFLFGICGGFQMLGEGIIDELGSDTGIPGSKEKGLGYISARTTFSAEKRTKRVTGNIHEGTEVRLEGKLDGYEIHLGKTCLSKSGVPFLKLENGNEDGFYGKDGKLIGTYLHHLFHNDEWRNYWLNSIRMDMGIPIKECNRINELKDERFNELASQIKTHLNWHHLKDIMNRWGNNK